MEKIKNNIKKIKEISKKVMTWKGLAIVVAITFVFTQVVGLNLNLLAKVDSAIADYRENKTKKEVLPNEVVIPVWWNDAGRKLASTGVIDVGKFEKLFEQRGGIHEETKKLLYESGITEIKINEENAGQILNLLWAFGLANKNRVLEEGPMTEYDTSKFASTGGWSLADGNPMSHYSKHDFVNLDESKQELVERVAKGIYRPCCGNHTYFPDCNHGMAMLGLLELMADRGLTESQMYEFALKVNSYWFPDTYLTIAKFMKEKRGIDWSDVDPKEVLGNDYSSAVAYRQIRAEIEPVQISAGGSCGV